MSGCRSNQRRLKSERIRKKANFNKEKNRPVHDASQGWMRFQKPWQRELLTRFGMKVHVHDLIDAYMALQCGRPREAEHPMGNTTWREFVPAFEQVILNEGATLPFDAKRTHDMTRWKSSKRKDRIRASARDEKRAALQPSQSAF